MSQLALGSATCAASSSFVALAQSGIVATCSSKFGATHLEPAAEKPLGFIAGEQLTALCGYVSSYKVVRFLGKIQHKDTKTLRHKEISALNPSSCL